MDQELNPYKNNTPIDSCQNIPLALSGHCGRAGDGCINHGTRRYTKAYEVETLAVERYRKNGKPITCNDLLPAGLALHKRQSQTTLKHCRRNNILFTLKNQNHRPQQYYPTCLKSEILKAKIAKIIPVRVTQVGHSSSNLNPIQIKDNNNSISSNSRFANLESAIIQSLEGYVLPLLSSASLRIHKIQFRLKIIQEYYNELNLSTGKGNNGKQHIEIIGKVRVSYLFYANGTVMIFTENSNHPFKLEDDTDRSRLMAFFGQVRDRMIVLLADRHERVVPDLMEWYVTQCDINKDIVVSDWIQFTGLNMQMKHLDHIFRVYVKALGKHTVCRVEESIYPKSTTAVEAINNTLNPFERIENKIDEIGRKIDDFTSPVKVTNNGQDSVGSGDNVNLDTSDRRSNV